MRRLPKTSPTLSVLLIIPSPSVQSAYGSSGSLSILMDRHDALELYTEVKAVTVRLSKIAGERKDQRKEYKLVRAGGARTRSH